MAAQQNMTIGQASRDDAAPGSTKQQTGGSGTSQTGAGRQTGYELLRIIAMAMVITLHYLGKGGFLTDPKESFFAADYLAWFLEAFCVAAVDIYVLISGFFLADAAFRPGRLLRLWAQVFFYSAGVPAVLVLTGILPVSELGRERLLTFCFPVLREHYWFVTAYVLMCLFAPFLGKAARSIPQKQFRLLLLLLFVIFSVSKSVLPFDLPLDRGGYDALWFVFLFLAAAYLRIYGLPFLQKKGRGLCCYLLCSLLIFGLMNVYRLLYQSTGRLADFIGSPYQYNHVLCLCSAIALFCVFGSLQEFSGRLRTLVLRISSCTFGIYLLHENEAVRYLWQDWLFAGRLRGSLTFPAGVLAAVLVWYGIGIVIELIRQKVFGWVFRDW